MRILFAAFLLLASPALATQDAWPALFDVTGVAADDVLNIRAAPGASSEIVGSFAPTTKDIEVIRPNDRHSWGLVNIAEGNGWVSLAFLRRQPGQYEGAFPDIARCAGTEPFWSLARSARTLTLTGPDRPTRHHAIAEEASFDGRIQPFILRAGDLTVVLRREACSDGMSDRAFGLSVALVTPDAALSGCCTLGP